MTETFEFVSPKHPDKQCDIIADTILETASTGINSKKNLLCPVLNGMDFRSILALFSIYMGFRSILYL